MAKTPRSLAGKVVAITGGGRGIGRATAAALIAEGARVAVGDIDAGLAVRTAEELRQSLPPSRVGRVQRSACRWT